MSNFKHNIKQLTASAFCLLALGAHDVFAASDSHNKSSGHADASHGGDHHAEGSVGLPQLDVTTFPSQLFWLLVTFVFLYVIFSKKNLPEISSVLENRKNHIQNDLETAGKTRLEAEQVQNSYEESLNKAREDATNEMSSVNDEISAEAEKASNEFREHSEKEIAKAEKNLSKAKKEVLDSMDTIAAEIASEAAQKIVGISTDVDQAKSVVQLINGNNKNKAA
jgi:F-type H+-transporting ATPase subunit b